MFLLKNKIGILLLVAGFAYADPNINVQIGGTTNPANAGNEIMQNNMQQYQNFQIQQQQQLLEQQKQLLQQQQQLQEKQKQQQDVLEKQKLQALQRGCDALDMNKATFQQRATCQQLDNHFKYNQAPPKVP